MPTQITSNVLESYLHCLLKGYLKLTGQSGCPSSHEELMSQLRSEVRLTAIDGILRGHSLNDVVRCTSLSIAVLKEGASFILDADLEFAPFSLHFDGLKRVSGASKLGTFHYVPVQFYGSKQIRKPQKLLLGIYGVFLGRLQGKRPAVGIIMHSKGCRTQKVQLDRHYREADAIIHSIEQMRDSPIRPSLILNDHCQVCEFRRTCQLQATKDDNLSLLRGIQPKEIKRYARKGIFTTTQLAHTFRPRRKGKRLEPKILKRQHALQAMAVRDKTIYVLGAPELPTSQVKVYLDVEADPEENYVYLIGMVICDANGEKSFSFWAEDQAAERDILEQFLRTLSQLEDFVLFSYGSYEKAFLTQLRTCARDTAQIDRALSALTNVLSVIYKHVYFPTWSNGLKDIGGCLGCSWQSPDASGIQSIVWRAKWEATHDDHWKRKLIEYNLDDCRALKIVTDHVYAIAAGSHGDGCGKPLAVGQFSVSRVQELDRLASRRKWGTVNFIYGDYAYINGCAYFNYQRQRIYARTIKSLRTKVTPIRQCNRRLRTTRRVLALESLCEKCGSTAVLTLNRHPISHRGPRVKRAFDLVATQNGIKLCVIESRSKVHKCQSCGNVYVPHRHSRLAKYFHGVQSFAMYLHVAHGLSFGTSKEIIDVFFNLPIQKSYVHRFKTAMAHYYEPTYRQLLEKLLSGPLLHVDETQVRLKGGKGYVWVFTNLEEVVFIFKPNREGEFLRELLKCFHGVLVSDFYAAYDSIECPQQKCLVHLIRDMNDDLLSNPFDRELQAIMEPFGALLRRIVEAIGQHGMKRWHLKRFKRSIAEYFGNIESMSPQSDVAGALCTRLLKYREKLFTFVDHDGVPWNNNNAENAIKRFALYRARVPGMMKESGLSEYLTLLSICQTCRYKGISFWKFLLSQEQDLGTYVERKRARRRQMPVETYPEDYMTPFDKLRRDEA